MKKLFRPSLFLALLGGMQLGACAAERTWPIVETSTQAQCAWLARNATAHIFENEAQWQRIYPTGEPPTFARTPDWARQVVLGLTLGARPSSGYVIELSSKQFELRDGTLWLAFRERAPAPGEIHEQVFTQPCIFIVTRRGEWHSVVLHNLDSGAEFKGELNELIPASPGAALIKASNKSAD